MSLVPLMTVNHTFTGVVQLGDFEVVKDCPGLVKGEPIIWDALVAIPAGLMVKQAFAAADGKLTLVVEVPVLSAKVSRSISIRGWHHMGSGPAAASARW